MVDQLAIRKEMVDDFISHSFEMIAQTDQMGIRKLKEAMGYSLLQGGKRFRPVLCLLIAESFGVAPKRVLPWALAVEMIHTYSLIHDDLPCMDNDDLRRGSPTNHKVYGETTALLAGDSLLTEAFRVVAEAFVREAQTGLSLVQVLSQASGIQGMVGGQVMDLAAQKEKISLDDLIRMHSLKTGALIRACAEGTALICGLPSEKIKLCREFGAQLGMAFQLKDDLLDSSEGKVELGSFPGILGFEKTQNYLQEVTNQALESLKNLDILDGLLHELVLFNCNRNK